MTANTARRYHHGDLQAAVVAAAVAEVETVGSAALSMREIARRAGVSHAAPRHHFGDKAGIFTAIAIEGFRLAAEEIRAAAADGFLSGGAAYVRFAAAHPGHFEVMFRPGLYRSDDPELLAARTAAFAILDESAQAACPDATPGEAGGLAVAGWSVAHGLATLWLTGNLDGQLGADPAAVTRALSTGLIALGKLAEAGQ